MSADPTATPPVRPIPVSSPADYEPPPRFRWVAPLCIGVAVGGLIGGAVTFALMTLSTKSRGELIARRFDINTALANTRGSEGVRVNSDNTAELGTYNRRGGTTNMMRRRILLVGQVPGSPDVGTFATALKTAVDAELARSGGFSTGGASTSSAGDNEYYGSFESTYYTRDGRRGQLDLEVVAHGTNFRATVYLFEAK